MNISLTTIPHEGIAVSGQDIAAPLFKIVPRLADRQNDPRVRDQHRLVTSGARSRRSGRSQRRFRSFAPPLELRVSPPRLEQDRFHSSGSTSSSDLLERVTPLHPAGASGLPRRTGTVTDLRDRPGRHSPPVPGQKHACRLRRARAMPETDPHQGDPKSTNVRPNGGVAPLAEVRLRRWIQRLAAWGTAGVITLMVFGTADRLFRHTLIAESVAESVMALIRGDCGHVIRDNTDDLPGQGVPPRPEPGTALAEDHRPARRQGGIDARRSSSGMARAALRHEGPQGCPPPRGSRELRLEHLLPVERRPVPERALRDPAPLASSPPAGPAVQAGGGGAGGLEDVRRDRALVSGLRAPATTRR